MAPPAGNFLRNTLLKPALIGGALLVLLASCEGVHYLAERDIQKKYETLRIGDSETKKDVFFNLINGCTTYHSNRWHPRLLRSFRRYCESFSFREGLENLELELIDFTRGRVPDLSHTKLMKASFIGANLSGVRLNHADLSYAKLIEANLTKAEITSANFTKADLSEAMLESALLNASVLTESKLYGANLKNADISEAKLNGSNLSHAVLTQITARRCQLKEVNLTGADLSKAKVVRSNLTGATLDSADLSSACLMNSSFRQASLSKVQLIDADLRGAKLMSASLEGALIEGGRFTSTSFADSNLSNAVLLGVDLSSVTDLSEEQLATDTSPLLCNVILPNALQRSMGNIRYRDCDRVTQVLIDIERFSGLAAAEEHVGLWRTKSLTTPERREELAKICQDI